MARYWVYIDNEVQGPYSVDQILRLRDFSRQTQVCVDDGSGEPSRWVSLSRVPEFSHIFEAAEQVHKAPPPAPKPVPKPAPPKKKPPVRTTPPEPVVITPRQKPSKWWQWPATLAIIAAIAAGIWQAYASFKAKEQRQTYNDIARIVLDHSLPSSSLYSSLRQYVLEKQLRPRWQIEPASEGLYNATLSWGGSAATSAGAAVYGFEVNAHAQVLRGINTAAQRLLAEGFPRPVTKSAAAPEPPKKPSFDAAVAQRREAIEKGEFQAVWAMFSERRRAEMIRAGISESGFVRLQALTRGLESSVKQTVLKTKSDSEDQRLVLLRQTQPKHPDLYLKQTWVLEDKTWKLDNEEKRSAEAADSSSASAAPAEDTAPVEPAASAPAPDRKKVLSLPGLSTDAPR